MILLRLFDISNGFRFTKNQQDSGVQGQWFMSNYTRNAKKSQLKKKQPQKKVTQQILNSRIYRKSQNVNEPEDDLETPEKYSRGTGTKYFYSWD